MVRQKPGLNIHISEKLHLKKDQQKIQFLRQLIIYSK